MKYVSEDYEVVINTQGGCSALERLGFKPQEDVMSKKVSIKKAVKASAQKVQSASAAKVLESVPQALGRTRNDLMLEVKARGIKNFRVMNKEELRMIVAGASAQQIEAVILAAVTRWKAGWKKNVAV